MAGLVEVSVGLGIVFSLLFSEFLGAAAGGIVVPGYIALHLHEPLRLIGTLVVAFVVYLTIKIASNFMFIYGRRRLVIAILLGFLFGYLSRQLILYEVFSLDVRMMAVGFIVPGLIANWMDRQGVIRTIAAVVIAASIVRLLLMLIWGGRVIN
jgi:poly-gamma-glutamate biosynthesis protein PgsC/CapC